MSRTERIRQILASELAPAQLEVIDDSEKHAGHAGAAPGGQTHYTLRIVSPAFQGLSKVQSHQLVYKLLAEEFNTGLHALSIDARA